MISLTAAVVLILGCMPGSRMQTLAAENDSAVKNESVPENDLSSYYVEVYDTVKYRDYLEQYADAAHPSGEIMVAGGDFTQAADGFQRASEYEKESDVALTASEGSIIPWRVRTTPLKEKST